MNKISVVVPIYNVEDYLRECINSIINQTYRNLQIILIDDGSTDSCGAICDEFALKDKRILVIHKMNGGLSDARNVGINSATGDFITFVDSDDVIEKDMIEYLFSQLSLYNADISVCQPMHISDNGQKLDLPRINFANYTLNGNYACMHDYLCNKGINTVAWGKLYNIKLWGDIKYPVGKYHEDVFTTYKIIAKASIITVSSERKYLYRIRPSSIMLSSFSEKHLDAVIGKEMQAEFILKHYPNEAKYAYSSIIYAANQCVLRMGIAGNKDRSLIDFLQQRYNKYEKYYILTNSGRFTSKLFSIAAFISASIVIKSIFLYVKLKDYAKNYFKLPSR